MAGDEVESYANCIAARLNCIVMTITPRCFCLAKLINTLRLQNPGLRRNSICRGSSKLQRRHSVKILLTGLVALSVCAPAFADDYQTTCQSCGSNYPAPGPDWVAAAIAFAQAHSPNVGDTITVCKTRTNGSSFWDWWTVKATPVTSAADLTFNGTGGDPGAPC